MRKLDLAVAALPIVGGINWGLVGLTRFDLVAKLTGRRFGETNTANRAIYTLVGVASALQAVRLAQGRGGR